MATKQHPGYRQPWHQRFGPIRKARAAIRGGIYRLGTKFLSTDDGRSMSAESLRGVSAGVAELDPGMLAKERLPYGDLAPSRSEKTDIHHDQAVFITARFRSGSTLLWNLFRQVPAVTAYYEPLNERRWFDPKTRGSHTDTTHLDVAEYWREYQGLEELGQYFRDEWNYRQLYMGGDAWDPGLKRYIETLIARAAGRPVLQFNRVDFRLPWLRRQFPLARIIHLYRHPRDQWCSSLQDPSKFPNHAPAREFTDHDHYYLRSWAADLRFQFPCLDDRHIQHPYQVFYMIWRLSFVFGRQFGHYSIAYEDLLAKPKDKIPELFGVAGIAVEDPGRLATLVRSKQSGCWRDYADAAWFARHENECERLLADYDAGLSEVEQSGAMVGNNRSTRDIPPQPVQLVGQPMSSSHVFQ